MKIIVDFSDKAYIKFNNDVLRLGKTHFPLETTENLLHTIPGCGVYHEEWLVIENKIDLSKVSDRDLISEIQSRGYDVEGAYDLKSYPTTKIK